MDKQQHIKLLLKTIAKQMNKSSMSAQAVGSAVGHNPYLYYYSHVIESLERMGV